jgi:UDP-GlcNAc:undecaprenyl-phosphate GlcNAc-1-phosphate transferase
MSQSDIINLGVVAVLGFLASAILTPLFRRLYLGAGLVDGPDGRRKHQQQPIPPAGGTAILISITAVILGATAAGFSGLGAKIWSLLGAAWIVGAVGWIDDARGLRGRHKLLGQFTAVCVMIVAGDLSVSHISIFNWEVELGLLGPAFTVFWMLGIINAINLIDGMDGLVGTVGVIVCVTFAAIASFTGQWYIALVALAVAGSLLGFLCYNLPPATVYLGDCGSMVVGLIVGALSIQGSLKGPAALTLATPLALLILPILDTSAAIVRRKLTGRSVYTTDRGHLHHCLLRRGLNRSGALLFTGFLGVVAAAGAFTTVVLQQDAYALLAIVVVTVALVATRSFGHSELALIKGRIVAVIAAFRNGHAVGGSHQLEVRLQGTIDWNLIWGGLAEAAKELNLLAIHLDVNAPALHEGYHARWGKLGSSPDSANEWRTELPIFLDGQVIGRLTAVGASHPGSIMRTLSQLADMLKYAESGASKLTTVSASPVAVAHHSELSDPVVAI